MEKEPFVSGVYRAEDDHSLQPSRTITQIVEDAKRARHWSRYRRSRPTADTRRIMQRMLGERED